MQFHGAFACHGCGLAISLAEMDKGFGGRHSGVQRIHSARLTHRLQRLAESALGHIKHGQANIYTAPPRFLTQGANQFLFCLLQISFKHVQSVGPLRTQFGSHAGKLHRATMGD